MRNSAPIVRSLQDVNIIIASLSCERLLLVQQTGESTMDFADPSKIGKKSLQSS